MAHLFWLSDEAWAAVEPHLPEGSARQAACGRPRGDLGHPACAPDRLPLARCSGRLRAAHDDLQSLPSLGAASHLAEDLREDGRGWRPT